MSFTDIFIRRPVLSIVVSLVILVIGLKAFMSMGVRQYPVTQNAVVTISTTYSGASPERNIPNTAAANHRGVGFILPPP